HVDFLQRIPASAAIGKGEIDTAAVTRHEESEMLGRRDRRGGAQIGWQRHRDRRGAVVWRGIDVATVKKDGHLREHAGSGDAVGKRFLAESAAVGEIAIEAVAAGAIS